MNDTKPKHCLECKKEGHENENAIVGGFIVSDKATGEFYGKGWLCHDHAIILERNRGMKLDKKAEA